MTESFTFSKEFTETNNKVRNEWEVGRKAARNVAKNLNELVAIIHKEHPDWTIKKIARQIWIANEDLEGFSTDTIYRNLNDDNRALLDTRFQNQKRNNVLEQSGLTSNPIVTEESSSRTLPTAYDVKEAETEEEEEEKKYQPSSDLEEFRKQHGTVEEQEQEQQQEEEPDTIYDKAFVDRLIKENAELVGQYSFDYDLEVKDQVLPLKVIVYPDKKTGVVRLRKK